MVNPITSLDKLVEDFPIISYKISVTDAEEVLSVSSYVEVLLGYTPSDFLSDKDLWLRLIHPEDRDMVQDKAKKLQTEGKPINCVYRIKGKDGAYVWIHDRAVRVSDDEGTILHYEGIALDISPQKEAEEVLERDRKIHRAVAEVSKPLLEESLDPEELSTLILHKALETTGSPYGYVSSLDIHNGKQTAHRITASRGMESRVNGSSMPFFKADDSGLFNGLHGHSLNTGSSFYTNAPDNHPAAGGIPDGHIPIRSYLSVPVIIGNRPMGQIAVANKAAGYQETDIDIVNRFAELYALVLQRKNKEASLKESEEKYRSLYEEAFEGILLFDSNMRLKDANPHAQSILGFTVKELRGMEPLSLIPEEKRKLYQTLLYSLIQGTPVHAEMPLKHKNGTILTVEFSGKKIGETMIQGIVRDISKRKVIEDELRKLKEAIEQSPVSIIITDTKGRIEYANPKVRELTGYSEREIIGRNPRVLKSDHHSDEFYRDLWTTIKSGKQWKGEFLNKKKNGEFYWESAAISSLTGEDGSISHFIAVKEDITERKKLEQLKEDVEGISRHDLKTPLNSIINMPRLVSMEGNLSAEQKNFLKIIEDSGYRMLKLINNSLDLFKMERGIYEFHPRQVDLIAVIQRTLTDLERNAESKNVNFHLTVDSGGAEKEVLFVHGEELLLYTMFANIFTNALEASGEGDAVTISVHTGSAIEISVCNRGHVPEEIKDKFFEKYTTFGKKNGTGLGTYSARMIVETHGGSITMESSKSTGTKIRIFLPL
jgi:PAS domain S-box-containing protein